MEKGKKSIEGGDADLIIPREILPADRCTVITFISLQTANCDLQVETLRSIRLHARLELSEETSMSLVEIATVRLVIY